MPDSTVENHGSREEGDGTVLDRSLHEVPVPAGVKAIASTAGVVMGEDGEDLPVTGEEWLLIAVDMVRCEEWGPGLLLRRRPARIAHRTSVGRTAQLGSARPAGSIKRSQAPV